METLNSLIEESGIYCDVIEGNNEPYDASDDWRATAHPYTIILRKKGNGRARMSLPFWTGSAWTKQPNLRDVLECVVSDSRVAFEGQSFESFCSDFGYDTDSIKALKTYKSCLKLGKRLMRFFGKDAERFVYADLND